MLATLWASRKFRITVYDIVVSVILHFGAEFLPPAVLADINWFILAAQPVLISLILGIAIEDSGTNSNPAIVTYVPPEPVTPTEPVTVVTKTVGEPVVPSVTNPPASMVPPVG